MKFTKWLIVPVMAFGLFTVGCGRPDSSVVEAPQQSDEEVAAADANYDEQYGETMSEADYDDGGTPE